MSNSYQQMFPGFTYVCVPLNGAPYGSNADPDTVFGIYDKAPGSRVVYQRASVMSGL